MLQSKEITKTLRRVEPCRISTGENEIIENNPIQAKFQLLTQCGFLEEQREGRESLDCGVKGLIVEISLSTGGGRLLVAPTPVQLKLRPLKSNQGNHCVPDVLIALLIRGEGWRWTATTKSGEVKITSNNKHCCCLLQMASILQSVVGSSTAPTRTRARSSTA